MIFEDFLKILIFKIYLTPSALKLVDYNLVIKLSENVRAFEMFSKNV